LTDIAHSLPTHCPLIHCPPIAHLLPTHHLLIAYLLLTHYRLLNLFKTRDFCFLTNITIAVFWHKNSRCVGAHLMKLM
jgi:hypothetical protein